MIPLHHKRLGSIVICVLCIVSVLLVNPVAALSTSSSLVSATTSAVTSLPEPPVVDVDNGDGRLVSVVRYRGTTTSAIIGCLEEGTVITVVEELNHFYKIDCYDMYGYIAKGQVAKNEAGEYVIRCDKDSSESKYLQSYSAQDALDMKSQMLGDAPNYKGVKYVWGGNSKWGFDCSGLIFYLYQQIGIDLHRSALTMMQDSVIIAEEDLQPGDLVFYSNTGGRGFGSHVALYLGDGMIIHASPRRGVIIEELHNPYMYEYYQCCRRVVLTDVAVSVTLPTVNSITSAVGSNWRN